MIKKYFLVLFVLNGLVLKAQQAPTLAWEYKEREGTGEFIRADSQGNIIVVGATNYITSLGDYARIRVIKQDRNGNIIWQDQYLDSLTQQKDRAFDVAIDTFDNIYIAGRTNWNSNVSPPDHCQSILLKYNSQGNLLWKRKWGNSFSMGGGAYSMKIFQNKYIYIAGYMDSWTTGNTNSFIAQYDSSGILNWADTTNNNYENFIVDVEVDKLGNAYTTGVTACCLPGYDAYVSKYNLFGVIDWSRVLTDSIHLYFYPNDAVLDDSANLYIGGETLKPIAPADFDFALAKIDSAGNQKWFSTYANTINSDWERPKGIILDLKSDCYLFGTIALGGGGQGVPVVSKFKKNGDVEWNWKYDSLNGGAGGIFKTAVIGYDSTLILGGVGKAINYSHEGRLALSITTNGFPKWIYEDSCECYFNDIIESDSSFFATGWIYKNLNFNYDTLFTCRLEYDSTVSIRDLRGDSYQIPFPNPFTDLLTFKNSLNRNVVQVKFYNLIGELVLDDRISSIPGKIITTGIHRGVYIVEIHYSDNTFNRVKLAKI